MDKVIHKCCCASQVIHKHIKEEDAIILLKDTYHNILDAFVNIKNIKNINSLRLLPISSGQFSGRFKPKEMAEMTNIALLEALRSFTKNRELKHKTIEMCIYVEDQFDMYTRAFHVCKNGAKCKNRKNCIFNHP